MTTIINTPPVQAPAPTDSGSGTVGILVGVVLVAALGFLFIAYGLPAMRKSESANTGSLNPTVNIPDKINVDIK